MISTVIFDLDGVLADTAALHDAALNRALREVNPDYCISYDEFIRYYGSLTTLQKLSLFSERNGLQFDEETVLRLYEAKKKYTHEVMRRVEPRQELRTMFEWLKEKGYRVAVCSNAGAHFVRRVLEVNGVLDMCDLVLTNQDVCHPKPSPEIYLTAMLKLGVGPTECLIYEDSYYGAKAAYASGAKVCLVSRPEELDWIRILYDLLMFDDHRLAMPVHAKDKLNVLIPMAGAGSRFERAGYADPKPLIPVRGKPLVGVTLESLANVDANYIFIVQRSHYEKYDLGRRLDQIVPGCKVVQIDGMTEGAACTTLLAKDHIDNDRHLLIINSDQLILWNRDDLIHMLTSGVDGGIVVFEDTNPKWSFAKTGRDGYVTEVAEKRPISNLATAGIYHWRQGSDYVKYAEQMIAKDIRVNNEFYTCPVYNEAVADGKRIRTYTASAMWGLGTPEDLDYYLKNFKG